MIEDPRENAQFTSPGCGGLICFLLAPVLAALGLSGIGIVAGVLLGVAGVILVGLGWHRRWSWPSSTETVDRGEADAPFDDTLAAIAMILVTLAGCCCFSVYGALLYYFPAK